MGNSSEQVRNWVEEWKSINPGSLWVNNWSEHYPERYRMTHDEAVRVANRNRWGNKAYNSEVDGQIRLRNIDTGQTQGIYPYYPMTEKQDGKVWAAEWYDGFEWRNNYDAGVLWTKEDAVDNTVKSHTPDRPHWKFRARNTVTGEIWSTDIQGETAPEPKKYPTREAAVAGHKVDMKVRGTKPQMSQIPYDAAVYAVRAFEFGAMAPGKYERGNYLRPTPDTLAAFDRLLEYLDAMLRHGQKLTLAMNRVRGCTDKDEASLRAAAAYPDLESGLPHLSHMLTSGLMAVQQAVDAKLIPLDPGRPWVKK
jgi:hypothetical protein